MTEREEAQVEDRDLAIIAGRKQTFEQIQDEIAAMLDIPDEELDDAQKAAMDEYLNMLASQEADKIDGFGSFVKMMAGMIDACKKESRRLASKAKTAEERIASLKNRYLEIMRAHNLQKVKGKIYSLSLRKSESELVPESEIELAKLHEKYPEYVALELQFKPNKPAIKDAIKAGVVIPGCEIQENLSLQIR